jgi:hypothetical protein
MIIIVCLIVFVIVIALIISYRRSKKIKLNRLLKSLKPYHDSIQKEADYRKK